MKRRPPRSTLLPSTSLFRSAFANEGDGTVAVPCGLVSGVRPLYAHLVGHGDLVKDPTVLQATVDLLDRKSTRLNSSHANISYAVFCLKKNTRSHQMLLNKSS